MKRAGKCIWSGIWLTVVCGLFDIVTTMIYNAFSKHSFKNAFDFSFVKNIPPVILIIIFIMTSFFSWCYYSIKDVDIKIDDEKLRLKDCHDKVKDSIDNLTHRANNQLLDLSENVHALDKNQEIIKREIAHKYRESVTIRNDMDFLLKNAVVQFHLCSKKDSESYYERSSKVKYELMKRQK